MSAIKILGMLLNTEALLADSRDLQDQIDLFFIYFEDGAIFTAFDRLKEIV